MSNAGYSKQWVSGPCRSETWIGDGDIGSFRLVLYWGDGEVRWVDFELFEVIGTDGDGGGPRLYHRRGSDHGMDMTADLNEAESVAEGFIKGDGCTQFTVSAVHVDHRQDLENLLRAFARVRYECALAMDGSAIRLEYD